MVAAAAVPLARAVVARSADRHKQNLEANSQSCILVKTLMIQCLWLVADLYFDDFMTNAKSLSLLYRETSACSGVRKQRWQRCDGNSDGRVEATTTRQHRPSIFFSNEDSFS